MRRAWGGNAAQLLEGLSARQEIKRINSNASFAHTARVLCAICYLSFSRVFSSSQTSFPHTTSFASFIFCQDRCQYALKKGRRPLWKGRTIKDELNLCPDYGPFEHIYGKFDMYDDEKVPH
jgi:hypothetical protein